MQMQKVCLTKGNNIAKQVKARQVFCISKGKMWWFGVSVQQHKWIAIRQFFCFHYGWGPLCESCLLPSYFSVCFCVCHDCMSSFGCTVRRWFESQRESLPTLKRVKKQFESISSHLFSKFFNQKFKICETV